jgi:hypothetical protein
MNAAIGAYGDGRIKRLRGDGPIRFRTSFRNTIYDVMRGRGWQETDRCAPSGKRVYG